MNASSAIVGRSGKVRALAVSGARRSPGFPDLPTIAEEAWGLEVERRVGQIEHGRVQLIPGDEVFARLRRRLG